MMKDVLAFDFGASGGRSIKAHFENDVITYEEIHRFENVPIYENGQMCHNVDMIYSEIKKALKKAGRIDSMSFDTWGVDYVLIDKDGNRVKPSVHYRDERTKGMCQKAFKLIPKKELYSLTANQIMPINTLFQLMSDNTKGADKLLFMPDYFAYLMCKIPVCEKTIASTSQMLDLTSACWCDKVLSACNIDKNILLDLVDSATVIGEYNGIKVVAGAGHDTQCAVVSMPALKSETPAFLSCGTWSLIGTEIDSPIITESSMNDELSNELGANGKINYLKNISGLWLIQETKRALKRQGFDYSFNDLEMMARAEKPFVSFINPDDELFATQGDLPQRVRDYCKRTSQPVPQTIGAVVRTIYESLAMKYRFALSQISKNTGKTFDVLHLLGGGTKDGFLCQMTADSLGIRVVAGPTEATALGNIALQLIALNEIKDVDTARNIIAKSEKLKSYIPKEHGLWNEAYEIYKKQIIDKEN